MASNSPPTPEGPKSLNLDGMVHSQLHIMTHTPKITPSILDQSATSTRPTYFIVLSSRSIDQMMMKNSLPGASQCLHLFKSTCKMNGKSTGYWIIVNNEGILNS